MTKLLKMNLSLWLLTALVIAAGGDALARWAFTLILGQDQAVTLFLNVAGAAFAVIRLSFRLRRISRYDLAMALPAIATCLS